MSRRDRCQLGGHGMASASRFQYFGLASFHSLSTRPWHNPPSLHCNHQEIILLLQLLSKSYVVQLTFWAYHERLSICVCGVWRGGCRGYPLTRSCLAQPGLWPGPGPVSSGLWPVCAKTLVSPDQSGGLFSCKLLHFNCTQCNHQHPIVSVTNLTNMPDVSVLNLTNMPDHRASSWFEIYQRNKFLVPQFTLSIIVFAPKILFFSSSKIIFMLFLANRCFWELCLKFHFRLMNLPVLYAIAWPSNSFDLDLTAVQGMPLGWIHILRRGECTKANRQGTCKGVPQYPAHIAQRKYIPLIPHQRVRGWFSILGRPDPTPNLPAGNPAVLLPHPSASQQ